MPTIDFEATIYKTHWALSDHQGSVRDVIDNSGTVLNHIVYDSFGQVTSETDPNFDFRFGYTGRELDEETGMMYYRARYFDPAVGIVWVRTRWGLGRGMRICIAMSLIARRIIRIQVEKLEWPY